MDVIESSGVHEQRAARRRALRRRQLIAVLLVAGAVAGAVVGVLRATGGGAAPVPPPSVAPAEPVAAQPPLPAPAAQTGVPDQVSPNATVTIAAVGDIVMGSTPDLPPGGGATFFAEVDEKLEGEVVLGNLEGTLSTGGSSKCGSGSRNCFAFHTPPSYARWLERAGFTVLNLANNHAYDYGQEGMRQTRVALRRQKLLDTGRPGQIRIQRAGPVRVAILGFASYPWAQDLTDIPAARRLVRKATGKADLVIVTFHGGAEGSDRTHVPNGTEFYLGENRGNLRAFAHAVVDAGADLVVGHGPHVLRGMEWYKERLIAYSLGNFGGYGVFSLSGVLSVSGILQVTLRADGGWVRGKLVATQLVGKGVPALDPAERAHGLVRTLSREDFGRRAVRITRTGVLRPPAS
jgi:poly-gamma-glutamate capsule biosynthesis protein CapA/YwtB (metallophosphatase superfamily)